MEAAFFVAINFVCGLFGYIWSAMPFMYWATLFIMTNFSFLLKTIVFCLAIGFFGTASAQKKLHYNSKGELSKADYQALLKNKKYQAISAFDTVSTKPLLVYAIYIKNKKLGILNDSGIEVTPALYDGIEGMNIGYTTVMFGFHENFPVKIGKKYGLISNLGKVILPMEYDYIRGLEKKSIKRKHKKEAVVDSIIIAQKGDEELYFSPKGKLLSKKIDPSLNESIEVVEDNRNYYSSDRTPKEQAEITPHGTIYKKLENGYAIVSGKVDGKNYRQGLVHLPSNELILPLEYSYLIQGQPDKLIGIKDKAYTIMDYKGNLLLPDVYEGIEAFNKVYKIKKGGKTALYSSDLKPLTEFVFDYFGSSGPDFMIAKIANKFGVVDSQGKEIVPFVHQRIEGYFKRYGSGFAFFKTINDRLETIIDTNGKLLTAEAYEEITPECTIEEHSPYGEMTMPIDHDYDAKNNHYFIVRKENKYGLLSNDFKPLVPIEYDYLAKSYHKDFVIVGKLNSKRGKDLSLLNIATNTTILPYSYYHFKYLGGTYFMIYQNGQMAVCNFKGEIIIPLDKHTDFSDRYYYDTIYRGLNRIDGRKRYYLIDYQGTQIDMRVN